MRIAHIGSKGIPSRGGTERVVEAIAVRQSRRHDVTVYGSRNVCASEVIDGVRVVALPSASGKHIGPVALQAACAMHALARGRYDVVHLHGTENAFILPLLRLRYRVVTTSHGPAYQREKWSPLARRLIRSMERLAVREASVATAVAANQATSLSESYGRPVIHVPNGIEVQAPDVDAALELLRLHDVDANRFWLFAAARVDPTKGCDTLLDALATVESPAPLVVVGDLGHAPGYEDRLRELGAGKRVTFIARLDDKATLMGLLRLAELFVFPSTVEAMSMMLLEALAAGVPVIASDIPENLAVLPEGVASFRTDNAADLAERLREFLATNPQVSRSRAEAAAAEVRRTHDWDAIAADYEAIYEELVSR